MMRSTSTQGFGILVLVVAFTLLAGAMTAGENVLPVLLALVGAGISAGIFLNVKSWEHSGK